MWGSLLCASPGGAKNKIHETELIEELVKEIRHGRKAYSSHLYEVFCPVKR